MRALINHPSVGSVWMDNCEIMTDENGRKFIIGDVWDDSDVGSLFMPIDYRGKRIAMNFPATCIRALEE